MMHTHASKPMIIKKLMSQLSKAPTMFLQKTLQNHAVIRKMTEGEAFNKDNYHFPKCDCRFCASQGDKFFCSGSIKCRFVGFLC